MKALRFWILMLAGLWLWACSSKSGESDNTKDPVFVFSQEEPTTLDPIKAESKANIRIVSQLYSGLFEFNDELSVQPNLVENYTFYNDKKTLSIVLRKGIKFVDDECFEGGKGREVVAQDVAYSLKRVIDKNSGSTGSWVLRQKLLKDGNEISDTAIKVLDRYHININLQRAYKSILHILAMPYTFVVPHEAVEKYGLDFSKKPVGFGPFKLKTWGGEGMFLEKNPYYGLWKKDDANQPLPYLGGVQIQFIADQSQEINEFLNGSLDMVDNISGANIAKILNPDGNPRAEISERFTVFKVPYMSTEYIGFQMDPIRYEAKEHPFLNIKVRKALSYAVNRQELITYFRSNLGIPGTSGFVPKAMPSFDPNRVKGYDFDPEKATNLLKEAGFPDGKNFPEIAFYTTPDYIEMAELLKKQWKSVLNINVRIEQNPFPAHNDLVKNGAIKFFRAAWLGDYPDEENFLHLFLTRNFAPDGPNKTRYSNPQFDKLFDNIHETEGFERHDEFYKLDQMIMDDSPIIVLYYDQILRLTQKNISGMSVNGLNSLRLEKVKKSKPEKK
jgi:peptide/nickel transport system substrate-binding protein